MKEMIFGLTLGFIAGAFLTCNCKPCKKVVDEVSTMAEDKMKSIFDGKQSGDCKCE